MCLSLQSGWKSNQLLCKFKSTWSDYWRHSVDKGGEGDLWTHFLVILVIISKYLSFWVERSPFPPPLSLSRNGKKNFSLEFEGMGDNALEVEERTEGHFMGGNLWLKN